ncbi:hypothetical protein MMC14_001258 [Varicellaria rhodocarpa]|nr:hypothetical protein [Varicellaria rhodocarpa]
MDHLNYPEHPAVPSVEIPFLCDDVPEYDGLGFSTYPFRHGWAHSSDPLKWVDCSDDELAIRAQVWLFFGVITEYCGDVIPCIEFREISELGSFPRVSNVILTSLLERQQRMHAKEVSRSFNGGSESIHKLQLCLREALRCSEILDQRIYIQDGLLSRISFSIRTLIQTIGCKFQLSISPSIPQKAARTSLRPWRVPASKFIQNRMIQSGWCPAQTHHLCQQYSCTALYYLSGLPRYTKMGYDHHQCTISECTVSTINEETYQSQHTDACNNPSCSFVGVDSAEVSAIIQNNAGIGIPLISCSVSAIGKTEVKLVSAEQGTKYVAISHVWAGGLGNPRGNALPECQLGRLMYLVRRLNDSLGRIGNFFHSDSPLYFWMDTFCVPVGEDFKFARKTAIGSMAKIYTGAITVLVLDPELQHIKHQGMTIESLLAYVLCSAWMSRCWTLQERGKPLTIMVYTIRGRYYELREPDTALAVIKAVRFIHASTLRSST